MASYNPVVTSKRPRCRKLNMEKVEWELVQQALMSTAHRSDPVVEFQYAYGHGSGGGGRVRWACACGYMCGWNNKQAPTEKRYENGYPIPTFATAP